MGLIFSIWRKVQKNCGDKNIQISLIYPLFWFIWQKLGPCRLLLAAKYLKAKQDEQIQSRLRQLDISYFCSV